jgi:hypothetical protein
MAPRRKRRSQSVTDRVRHLLALDAAQVMKRLTSRQEEMVALFSRLRDRTPMLRTVSTWFDSITFGQLGLLEAREQRAVTRFYELLSELRWYLEYTEDMPSTVQQRLSAHVARLVAGHARLRAVIGPATGGGGPVVEAEVVSAVATLAKAGRR